MRSRKSIAKWNLFFHYMAIIIGIVNGLVIVPFYLKFIESGLFGAWLATGNILVWLTIIEPGVGDVLQQRISQAMGAKNLKEVSLFISSGVLISTIIAALVVMASLVFQLFIVQILKLPNTIDAGMLIQAFQITAIGTGFTMLSYAFVGSNQGLQSSLGIGIIYLAVNIVSIALNFMLLFNGFGLLSIAYANLARGVGLVVLNALYLMYRMHHQHIPVFFEWAFLKRFSKLFSYTFLSKISTTIVSNLDLIIVARFVNPEMVTMLELTRRPIRVIQGFTDRVSVAFMAPLANLKGEGNLEKIKTIFIKFMYLYAWAIFLIIFGFVALNQYLITVWTGNHIYIGHPINMLLCATLLIGSFMYNISNFTYALGDIKGNSTIAIKKSVVYLVLIFVLSYFLGIYGVVLAALLATLATEVWYYPKQILTLLPFTKKELNDLTLEIIKTLAIGVAVASVFLALNFKAYNWFWLAIWALAFSCLYFIGMFIFSKNLRLSLFHSISIVKAKLFGNA